jgi:hypothetical protein
VKFFTTIQVAAAVTILFFSNLSLAGKDYGGDYFKSLRNDMTIPEKCREVNLSHFATHELETFYWGPVGAQDRGFTYEYPIERGEASELWSYARQVVQGEDPEDIESKISSKPDVLRDFKIIVANYEGMDFDFESEGEVLEILSILEMGEMLSDEFYVYGSVYYADGVAGELDLMVGRNADCQIVSIGEAKLGLKSLGKAREQMDRFKNFLRTHLHRHLNPFALEQYVR